MDDYKAHNPPRWLDALLLVGIGMLIAINWGAIIDGLRHAGVIK